MGRYQIRFCFGYLKLWSWCKTFHFQLCAEFGRVFPFKMHGEISNSVWIRFIFGYSKKWFICYICRKSIEIRRFSGQIRDSDFFQKCMITAPTWDFWNPGLVMNIQQLPNLTYVQWVVKKLYIQFIWKVGLKIFKTWLYLFNS